MPIIPPLSSSVAVSQPLAHERSRSHYLATAPLRPQLREHCKIYLEEKLYTQSLTLLHSILSSSISTSSPVQVPATPTLSLIWTLSIHPYLASSPSPDKVQSANLALQYLTLLNSTVGPIDSKLTEAVRFTPPSHQAGRRRKREGYYRDEDSDRDDDGPDAIKGKLVGRDSVASKGRDFWRVLGWVFNCAAKYEKRWVRWKLWTEMVLQVLEDDWIERLRLSEEAKLEGSAAEDKKHDPQTVLAESLIVSYIGGAEEAKYGGLRHMMRAIFANGSDKDLSDFPEVFKKETKEAKEREIKIEGHRNINIDAGDYGDYLDDSSDQDSGDNDLPSQSRVKSEPSTPRRKRKFKSNPNTPQISTPKRPRLTDTASAAATASYNNTQSLSLRRRTLSLLFKVAAFLPSHFITHDHFLDTVEEFLRFLPLSTFSSLVMPPMKAGTGGTIGTPSIHISLLQQIVFPLLAGTGAQFQGRYHLTQQKLQKAYLPWASVRGSGEAAIFDNARLCLCLEGMVRLLRREVGLGGDGGKFRSGMEKGVKERKEVVDEAWKGIERERRKDREFKEAREVWEACEGRLRALVEMFERDDAER